MGYISICMGDCLSALLVSLMALQLVLVDQNPFWFCLITKLQCVQNAAAGIALNLKRYDSVTSSMMKLH